MNIKTLEKGLGVSAQIDPGDVAELAEQGYRAIISNRPDGEEPGQPTAAEMAAAAKAAGLTFRHIPVTPGQIADSDVAKFREALNDLPRPIFGFCRTGTRTTTLWALSRCEDCKADDLVETAAKAGYDIAALRPRLETAPDATMSAPNETCDVLVVGGGSAGIAAAASLLKRRPGLNLRIVEPSEHHYYQPGWTMVGGGIFKPERTERPTGTLMPDGAKWEKTAVETFDPDRSRVKLADGRVIGYRILVAAPGLKLDWAAVPGLPESLGRNGVTSNYSYKTAPYTWELVQSLKGGRALFTQPPMPIKCAGAPQKAMYLSADHWKRQGVLKDVEIEFHNAGGALFGVPAYVPALMKYVEAYGIGLNFGSNLVAIDGEAKTATFKVSGKDGESSEIRREFDMIHVCPPQTAPDFVKASPLADEAGWIDVDQHTLRHKRFENVFGLGDATNTPNAKTAAAARKQAPIAAVNVLAALDGKALPAAYDGYGSCPLTVERGKIVLAEFGYGGALLPSFPKWLIDGTKPSRLAWHLKAEALPEIYWRAMLKGREWLVDPDAAPVPAAASAG